MINADFAGLGICVAGVLSKDFLKIIQMNSCQNLNKISVN